MAKRKRSAKKKDADILQWKGPEIGRLQGDNYYACVEYIRNKECIVLEQDSCVCVEDKKAIISILWENVHGEKMMEIRYMKAMQELPLKLQRQEQKSNKDIDISNWLYETDQVDEILVGNITEKIVEDHGCRKFYSVLTGSITWINPLSTRIQRSQVYGRRLKALVATSKEHNAMTHQHLVPGSTSVEQQMQMLEDACDQLQLSSIPEKLLGREEERNQIYHTLRMAILGGASLSNPVYISGLPGMGKTATVKEILRSLEHERDTQTLDDFTWIEVNGLHMPKPDLAYSIIWKALQKHQFRVNNFVIISS